MKRKMISVLLSVILVLLVALSGAAAEDSQDRYWTESGLEALWNSLHKGNPYRLSIEEKSAFFWEYASYMDVPLTESGSDMEVDGRFTINEDGTFEAEYSTSFRENGETILNETACKGTFKNVYKLSNWVYALETGNLDWAVQDIEFVVQEYMLFQIPGATENDIGIMKYELQNIARMEGTNPGSAQPFCFITAFDSSPMWYGRVKGSAPRTGIKEESPLGKTMHTVMDKVNVRKKASGDSKLEERLDKAGTEVTILATETDKKGQTWYYVSTPNGKKGYIRSDLLQE